METNLFTGVAPKIRQAFEEVLRLQYGVYGKVFHVRPYGITSSGSGDFNRPLFDIEDALDLVVSGRGDGIVLWSGGTTAANTTSYLTKNLDINKAALSIIGMSAGNRTFGRARIANKQVTTGSITTLAFPTATTITDSDSGFVTAGFAVGQTINIVTNSGTNDGTAIITAVTAGTITCSASTFTPETAATAGASTLTNYISDLITISADNVNLYGTHIGHWGDQANDLGGLKVTGNRIGIQRCHIVGAGNATPGAVATARSLLLDGCQEVDVEDCVIGTDTIAKEAANGEVTIDGGCWRIGFRRTKIICQSTTAGKVAVKSNDATSFSGIMSFEDCKFHNWNPNGITAIDDAFGGTGATSGDFAVDAACSTVGFTGWGAGVYVAAATSAASAAGGISTTE